MKSIGQTWKDLKTFLTEVRSEMKKVTFPSREEVMSTTAVVIIASIIFAAFLAVADFVIRSAYQGVIGVLS